MPVDTSQSACSAQHIAEGWPCRVHVSFLTALHVFTSVTSLISTLGEWLRTSKMVALPHCTWPNCKLIASQTIQSIYTAAGTAMTILPPDLQVDKIHKIQSAWAASFPSLNAAPQRVFEHQQLQHIRAHLYSQCHQGMACLQLTCLGPRDWTALSFVACLWLFSTPSQEILSAPCSFTTRYKLQADPFVPMCSPAPCLCGSM